MLDNSIVASERRSSRSLFSGPELLIGVRVHLMREIWRKIVFRLSNISEGGVKWVSKWILVGSVELETVIIKLLVRVKSVEWKLDPRYLRKNCILNYWSKDKLRERQSESRIYVRTRSLQR